VFLLQSDNNRVRCIEKLAKECHKYQNSVNDAWRRQHHDSAESLSSASSSHSAGTPPFGQTNHGIADSHMRSSYSYPNIPPSESSGRVHDRTPRSSLPMSSLGEMPPSHQLTRMYGPATAAVMQHVPFSFRPDAQLHQDPAATQNVVGILVPGSFYRHPLGVHRQDGRVDLSLNLLGESSAVDTGKTAKQKTITSEVSYRLDHSPFTGEQSADNTKPTYRSATHVNMLAPEDGGGLLSGEAETTLGRLQNHLSVSVFPATSSSHSSNAYSSVYINPQQAWVSSPQRPTTYISSLSSSCECLASVTSGSEAAARPTMPSYTPAVSAPAPPVPGSSSPKPSSDLCDDNPEYVKGRKCVAVIFTPYTTVFSY